MTDAMRSAFGPAQVSPRVGLELVSSLVESISALSKLLNDWRRNLMRRTLKLLLVLTLGLALRRGGGDGPDGPSRPGNGDGPDAPPPQQSPSGKINTSQGTESASRAVQTEAEQGRATEQSSESPQNAPDTGRGWTDAQRNNMLRLGEITDSRRVHILDGEYDSNGNPTGGGHGPGVGIPGKSEFPDRWEDDQIIDNIAEVARNPTTAPEERPNGGWIVQGDVDGVTIEVVLNRDGSVWTAYPIAGDGVVFNPEWGVN